MAVYRPVHVSFWQDPFVLGLTAEEKYFYIYLMTNSKTTQCGIYEISVKILEMETGYDGSKILGLIQKFIGYKKILYHPENREIMLLNWIKHNPINGPKIRACVEKELRMIKTQDFVRKMCDLSRNEKYPISTQNTLFSVDVQEETKNKQKQEKEETVIEPDRLLDLLNKYEVKVKGALQLDKLQSFLGVMEWDLIAEAVSRSKGKPGAYVLTILEDWNAQGFTKLSDLSPAKPQQQQQNKSQTAAERDIELTREGQHKGGNPMISLDDDE